MKLQKNKIVFVLIMVGVVLFIAVYAILTFGKDKKKTLEPHRIPTPDLEENPVEYESKLEAIEAIKEEREVTAPQLYPDHRLDDKGFFNPDYMEYEKQRIIDSVYRSGSLTPKREPSIRPEVESSPIEHEARVKQIEKPKLDHRISSQELALEHQLFFASNPKTGKMVKEKGVQVRVDGTQIVRNGHRLALRLETAVHMNGKIIPRNTRIYGFVKIQPNRVLIDLPLIGQQAVHLKAHDLQDGSEGIYIENRLQGDIRTNAIDNAIGEVNIPGIPQVSGIKRIFQRDNRAIKVAINDNYQMLLKP